MIVDFINRFKFNWRNGFNLLQEYISMLEYKLYGALIMLEFNVHKITEIVMTNSLGLIHNCSIYT